MNLSLVKAKYFFTGYKQRSKEQESFDDFFLDSIEILEEKCTEKKLVFSYIPSKNYLNLNRKLHGGVITSLVDCLTTVGIVAADSHFRPGVSVDLNTSFCGSVDVNQQVFIEITVSKIGKNLAFSDAIIIDEKGNILARGGQTKFLTQPKL